MTDTITKQPSHQLATLIAKFADSFVDLHSLWNEVKEKGTAEGFAEKELELLIRPLLSNRLGKQKVWYLFHKEEQIERVRKHRESGTNLVPNAHKKEPEESYPPSEDTKELNKQMGKRHGLPVTEVVAKGAEDQDWEAEYRKDQGGLGSLDKAEPFIVAIVEKDLTAARDLVMRQLTKLKGQGWHVIELTPRYIS
jgi:hypothetical protein